VHRLRIAAIRCDMLPSLSSLSSSSNWACDGVERVARDDGWRSVRQVWKRGRQGLARLPRFGYMVPTGVLVLLLLLHDAVCVDPLDVVSVASSSGSINHSSMRQSAGVASAYKQ
jgi:hypothetical protein